MRFFSKKITIVCVLTLGIFFALPSRAAQVIKLGSRRELFVDNFLISSKTNVQLVLHEPKDEGQVFPFDAPWEGQFCAYVTILHEGGKYRAYYRGKAGAAKDGVGELTCVAESPDGRRWAKPQLNLVEVNNSRSNNVILAIDHFSHNFSPFIDGNPTALPDQKYKAIAGDQISGLKVFASPDGLRWQPMQSLPVLTTNEVPYSYMFDSQNVAFWSEVEKRYLLYFRVYKNRFRRIARAESVDLLKWGNITLMEYRDAEGESAPVENLYINQTHPYFRAPQIYIAIAARFMPGRQVLTADEAKAIGVHPSYFKDISDAIFMTSRGRDIYDRIFMGAFIRPGIGAENWVSRTTYPGLNVVQTGADEMSVYVNQNYAQPTAHLRRYSLRLDGFSSLHAPYEGGELITPPLTFAGNQLLLNFSTSAAGGIKVAIVDAKGKFIAGYGFEDSVESIGNEIARPARWKNGTGVGNLAGQSVQLCFKMKDADLYALQFSDIK